MLKIGRDFNAQIVVINFPFSVKTTADNSTEGRKKQERKL